SDATSQRLLRPLRLLTKATVLPSGDQVEPPTWRVMERFSMERLFSTRASGLEVISLGSVIASGAGSVWDLAKALIIISISITTTITNGLRMRMVTRVGVVNKESLSVSMLVESRAPSPGGTGGAPVAPLAKAIEPGPRSIVQIGRALVLLQRVAAVDDEQLAGDVGGGFRGEKRDRCGDF